MHAVFVPLDPAEPTKTVQFKDVMKQIQPKVLVAWDQLVAMETEKHGAPGTKIIVCQDSSQALPEWRGLATILNDIITVQWDRTACLDDFTPSSQGNAIISFTSGTTSSPKGCPTTKAMLQHRWRKYPQRIRVCISSACYRAIYQGTVLLAWLNGGCVVIPSPEYELKALLNALRTETCTDVALVQSQIRDIAALMEREVRKKQRRLVQNTRLTGDLVDGSLLNFNGQGAMFVTGRSKDVVVFKANNIYQSIIEDCLNSVEGVERSQVVGIRHAHNGAVPVAVVKLKRTMDKIGQAKFFDGLNAIVVAEQGELLELHSIYSLDDLKMQDLASKLDRQDLED